MIRTLRTGIVLLLLLSTSVPVEAEEDLPAAAADVLEAVRSEDTERLTVLARAVEHDPWRVVDDLVAAGYLEAAKAHAAAAGEPYTAPLERYLEAVPKDDQAVRTALHRARGLVVTGQHFAALAVLEGVAPPEGTILAYRVPAMRTFIAMELGRRQEGYAHARVAREAAEALGRDLDAEFETVVDAYGRIGRHENPLVPLRAAERQTELSHYVGRRIGSAYCNLDLASACLGCYMPDRALRRLHLARDTFQEVLDDDDARGKWNATRVLLAWVHVRLCCAHDLAGEFPLAFLAGERAVEAFRALEDPVGEAEALWVLGDAHAHAGTLPPALECYRSARTLFTNAGQGFAEQVFELGVNEGSTLQEMGKHGEALRILTPAAEQVRVGAKGAVPAVTLMNLGEAQLKAGRPDLALATLRKALDALESDRVHEAWCRMLIADALTLRGTTSDETRLAEAKKSYRAALALLPEGLEPTLRLYILTGLGEVSLAQGKAAEALDHARRCMDLLADMTGGMADSEAVSARGHEDRLRATALGIASARAMEDGGAILEMLERSRAQAFLAALGGRRGVLRSTREPGARARIEAADRRLLQAVHRYRREHDAGVRKRVRAALESLAEARLAHHRTTASVERDARLRESAVLPKVVRLDDVHAALRPGDCAVLFGLLDRESLALVMFEGRAWAADLPARTQIEQACADLAAEDPETKRAASETALERLGEMLLGPLDLPDGVRQLLVSPDGALAHLPWPWLADHHFGRDVGVTLVPSATSLLALSSKRPGGDERLALGDPDYGFAGRDAARRLYMGGRTPIPLLESEAEARAAAGPRGKVLLGPDATERGLEEALAEAGPLEVLHLACHGVVNRSRPEQSALVLTPDAKNDGFLTALEISALEIPADLVVLSACESGRDRSARGEGIQGLVRAFLLAGASQLVVSMWKVDDKATRLFMERFYEEWAKDGVGTHEALRRARAAVDHPSGWAAWVVWGTPW